MTATHFRAYAPETATSRRLIEGEKLDIEHEIHNPVIEGEVKDGAAAFTAKQEIAYVVFYDDQESPAVVGRVDGPFGPGKVTVSLPDPAE